MKIFKQLVNAYNNFIIIGICEHSGRTTVLNKIIEYAGAPLKKITFSRDNTDEGLNRKDKRLALSRPGVYYANKNAVPVQLGAVPPVEICYILAAGAEYDAKIQKVIEQTVFMYNILNMGMLHDEQMFSIIKIKNDLSKIIFVYDDYKNKTYINKYTLPKEFKRLKYVYVTGVLTDNIILPIAAESENITFIIDDSLKACISPRCYENLLARGCGVSVLQEIKVAAVTVNPVSSKGVEFNSVEFREKLSRYVNVPIINVLEN